MAPPPEPAKVRCRWPMGDLLQVSTPTLVFGPVLLAHQEWEVVLTGNDYLRPFMQNESFTVMLRRLRLPPSEGTHSHAGVYEHGRELDGERKQKATERDRERKTK